MPLLCTIRCTSYVKYCYCTVAAVTVAAQCFAVLCSLGGSSCGVAVIFLLPPCATSLAHDATLLT